jgi:hypothetical protein
LRTNSRDRRKHDEAATNLEVTVRLRGVKQG